MITNPSSYSFTPPSDVSLVTHYAVTVHTVSDFGTLASETLGPTATGHGFTDLMAQVLTGGHAGVECRLDVQAVGADGSSPLVASVDTFQFRPVPGPVSDIVVTP